MTEKNSRPKHLQRVDNSVFMKKAIAEAKKWLRKIEETEESTQRFHAVDLKLFQDWHNLTFSPMKTKIDRAQAEYSHLIDLHNQSIYLAQKNRIPWPFAMIEILAEEELYRQGNAAERERIDLIREHRRRGIEEQVQREQQAEEKIFGDDFYFHDEDDEFTAIRDFAELSEDDIAEIFEIPGLANDFIFKAFTVLIPGGRIDLLRKIWKIAPPQFRRKVDKKIKEGFGRSAEELMNEAEKAFRSQRKRPGPKDSPREGERPNLNDEQRERGAEEAHAKPAPDATTLASKHFFRKIARRIHPDKLDLGSNARMKAWFSTTWHEVINAHNREDAEALRVLYHKILIVLDDYSELDVSDIRDAADSLKLEHGLIVRRSADIKKHPAWNFSKLKDFSKLEKKESKSFTESLRRIMTEVEALRAAHDSLVLEAELLREEFAQKKQRRRTNRRRRR